MDVLFNSNDFAIAAALAKVGILPSAILSVELG